MSKPNYYTIELDLSGDGVSFRLLSRQKDSGYPSHEGEGGAMDLPSALESLQEMLCHHIDASAERLFRFTPEQRDAVIFALGAAIGGGTPNRSVIQSALAKLGIMVKL